MNMNNDYPNVLFISAWNFLIYYVPLFILATEKKRNRNLRKPMD